MFRIPRSTFKANAMYHVVFDVREQRHRLRAMTREEQREAMENPGAFQGYDLRSALRRLREVCR